jgi:hypothetical protein
MFSLALLTNKCAKAYITIEMKYALTYLFVNMLVICLVIVNGFFVFLTHFSCFSHHFISFISLIATFPFFSLGYLSIH